MQKLIKAARLSFLAPYLILPPVIMLSCQCSFPAALFYTFLMPFAVSPLVIVLYLLCYILTVIAIILCFRESRRSNDAKSWKTTLIIAIAAALCFLMHAAGIVIFYIGLSEAL